MSDEHDRYDVIVVGSGGGLFGAYAAARRGLRTLVIEKSEFVGGTTAYSGAGIWLPGNPAEVRAGLEGGSAGRPPVSRRDHRRRRPGRPAGGLPRSGPADDRGTGGRSGDRRVRVARRSRLLRRRPRRAPQGPHDLPGEHRPFRAGRPRTARPATAVDRPVGRRGARDDGRRPGLDRPRPVGVHEHRPRRDPHEHRARAAHRRGRKGRRRRGRERWETAAAVRRARRAARRRWLRSQPRTPPALSGADHRRVDVGRRQQHGRRAPRRDRHRCRHRAARRGLVRPGRRGARRQARCSTRWCGAASG